MNLWRQRAQQKAQTDKRKGAKQGAAIMLLVRQNREAKEKELERSRQNQAAESGVVEGTQKEEDHRGQGEG
jgi:hypothetical protein